MSQQTPPLGGPNKDNRTQNKEWPESAIGRQEPSKRSLLDRFARRVLPKSLYNYLSVKFFPRPPVESVRKEASDFKDTERIKYVRSFKKPDLEPIKLVKSFNKPGDYPKIERGELVHYIDAETQSVITVEENRENMIEDLKSDRRYARDDKAQDRSYNDWIKQGNVYAIEEGGRTFLTLCPLPESYKRAGFADPAPTLRLLKLITKKEKNGEIEMPIDFPTGTENGRIDVSVKQEDNKYEITLKFWNSTSEYKFSYEVNETDPTKSLVKLYTDGVLERDLLLARAHFARNLG